MTPEENARSFPFLCISWIHILFVEYYIKVRELNTRVRRPELVVSFLCSRCHWDEMKVTKELTTTASGTAVTTVQRWVWMPGRFTQRSRGNGFTRATAGEWWWNKINRRANLVEAGTVSRWPQSWCCSLLTAGLKLGWCRCSSFWDGSGLSEPSNLRVWYEWRKSRQLYTEIDIYSHRRGEYGLLAAAAAAETGQCGNQSAADACLLDSSPPAGWIYRAQAVAWSPKGARSSFPGAATLTSSQQRKVVLHSL